MTRFLITWTLISTVPLSGKLSSLKEGNLTQKVESSKEKTLRMTKTKASSGATSGGFLSTFYSLPPLILKETLGGPCYYGQYTVKIIKLTKIRSPNSY